MVTPERYIEVIQMIKDIIKIQAELDPSILKCLNWEGLIKKCPMVNKKMGNKLVGATKLQRHIAFHEAKQEFRF